MASGVDTHSEFNYNVHSTTVFPLNSVVVSLLPRSVFLDVEDLELDAPVYPVYPMYETREKATAFEYGLVWSGSIVINALDMPPTAYVP